MSDIDSKEKTLDDLATTAVFPVSDPEGDASPDDATDAAKAQDAHRGLRMRHLQLIAISGSIGSAVFVSIGNPLTSGGPLALLIGIMIWCSVVWAISNCMVEMTTLMPVDGGFVSYASKYVDASMGLAIGWNYAITQWALICFELTTLNVITQYWNPDINPAIMISVGLVLLFIFNMWSVRFYGETEFWISCLKVLLIFGLFFFTFITMVGGNPLHDAYGFRYWKNPGVFASPDAKGRMQGIWDAVLWSTFAIVGPDYLSLVSGEVKNPRRILPRAFKTTLSRLSIFYILGALCVSIVTPYNDPALLGAISAGAPGAAKSPYVIAMNRMNIPYLPSIVNAIILTSLFSTANSFVFVGSRTLYGLGKAGHAPKVVTRLNRNGVPYVSVLITLALGCLSYLAMSAGTYKVLNWWINIVTSTQLVTWSMITFTYLRFRAGLKKQGLLDSGFLPYKSKLQPWSAWWAMLVCPITLLFSGYYVFLPDAFNATDFIFAYGSVFIFVALLIGYKAWDVVVRHRTTIILKTDEIDFHEGLEEIEAMTERAETKRASKPRTRWQRTVDRIF